MGNQLIGSSINSRNILVVYHYFEKDQSYIDNFCHFLRFGYDSELSYLIVVAGKHTIDLPTLDNIQYFFSENKNFDYGGYSAAINNLSIWEKYNFYFFINSSVRGPFIPSYDNQKWTDIFVDQFSVDVGIVGSAISITPSDHSIAKIYLEKFGSKDRNRLLLSHIQTTCYVLPRQTLNQLIRLGFYAGGNALNKDETVRDYEIHLSQLILDIGLNLRCVLPEYNQLDYRQVIVDPNPASREGDSGFEGSYFGRTAYPYESIFIKTSRATFSEADLMRLAYSRSIDSEVDKGLVQQKFMQSFIARMRSSALQPTKGRESDRKILLKFLKNKFK